MTKLHLSLKNAQVAFTTFVEMRWIILTFFIELTFWFHAQDYPIFSRTIDTEKGCPSDLFYDLLKHPNQSILLASDKGLYSFNGVVYKKIPFVNHHSNSVTNLLVAKDGKIWCRNFSEQVFCGNLTGLSEVSSITKAIEGENIVGLHELATSIYVVTNHAIYKVDSKSRSTIKVGEQSSLETSFLWNSELYVSDAYGNLFQYSKGKCRFISKLPFAKGRFLVWKNRVYAFNKELGATKVYRLENSIFEPFADIYSPIPFQVLNTVSEQQFFGAATTQGFVKINEKGQVEWLEKGRRITDLVQDNEENFWLSSLDNGLVCIPNLKIKYLLKNEVGEHFNNLEYIPNKGLVISNNRGQVCFFNSITGSKTVFDTKIGQNIEFIRYNESEQALFLSSGKLNLITQKFTPFYFGKSMDFDNEGRIFFALHSLSGFFRLNKNDERFKKSILKSILVGKDEIQVLREQRTRTLLHSKKAGLIVGYSDELIQYTNERKKLWRDKQNRPIFATSIIENEKGIWVSTTQNGVFLFNEKGQILNHWKVNEGISGEICRQLRAFDGSVFVVHDKGIDRLRKGQSKFENLSASLGIQHLVFSDIWIAENTIYLLTNKGLVGVSNSQSKFQDVNQNLFFTDWFVNDKAQLLRPAELPFNKNNISFHWHLTAFRRAQTEQLEYRLLPKMKHWRTLPLSTSSLDFFDLQPEDYSFELRFQNDSKSTIKHTFSITKPFWWTWWFLSLTAIGIFFFVLSIIRYTQSRFRKQQLFKERLVFSQLTALRSQMNPHFLYNVLNSLQGLIYSKKINEAGDYVSKFSDHLRQVLDQSSKQEISISDEIESLKLYLELEKLRFGEDFSFSIEKRSDIEDLTMIPSMVIQPFVENAIKHGLMHINGLKKLEIIFEKNDQQQLLILIIDNGIGWKAANELNAKRKDKPNSFALSAIENRLGLLSNYYDEPITFKHEDIVKEQKVSGTKITLVIPNKKTL